MSDEVLKDGVVIDSIKLNDFMSHADTDISLADFTIIHGDDNGVGKSSILHGLMFGLTTKTPLLLNDNVKVDEIISNWGSRATVTINGRYITPVETKTFESVVSRSKRGGNVKVKINSEEQASPLEVLGDICTTDEFLRLILIDGHDITRLLKGTPKDVSAIFDKLFSTDIISTIIDLYSTSKIGKTITELQRQVSEIEDMKLVVANAVSSAGSVRDMELELSTLIREIDMMRDEMHAIKQQENDVNAKAIDIQNKQRQVARLHQQKTDQESRISTLHGEITNRTSKIRDVKKMIDDIKHPFGIPDVKSLKKSRQEEMNALVQTIAREETIPNVIDILMDRVSENVNASCPVCGKHPHDVETLEKFKNEQGILFEERKIQLEALKESIDGITNAINRIDQLSVSITKLEALITQGKKDVETTRDAIDQIDEQIRVVTVPTLTRDESAILQRNESSELHGTITEKQRRVAEIEELIANAGDSTSTTRHSVEDLDAKIQDITDKITKLTTLKTKRDEIRRGLNASLKIVRENIIQGVNSSLIQWIQKLDSRSIIDNAVMVVNERTIRGETQYRYDINVSRNGELINFGTLSTGQKALVLLSVILTINDMSDNVMSLLLLDEIQSSGLDDNIQAELVKQLINVAKAHNVVMTSRSAPFKELTWKLLSESNGIKYNIYDCKMEDHKSVLTLEASNI